MNANYKLLPELFKVFGPKMFEFVSRSLGKILKRKKKPTNQFAQLCILKSLQRVVSMLDLEQVRNVMIPLI